MTPQSGKDLFTEMMWLFLFFRLADLLKRKKKRGKGDADSLNAVPLERQTWYHGKITADYAERYLRRDGNFLVREDPAKPGSCFIVVRHKRSPLHVPLCKVNSSKGTRIKYRLEESNDSFDSIAELINHYISEKKPLSPNTSAIITHSVSRDATMLSADDLKSRNANHRNRYVSNTGPSNLCPPKAPGTGPLRQRNIDKMGRKNSDPGLHLEINHNGHRTRHFTVGSRENAGLPPSPGNLQWTAQSKQREKIPEAFFAKAAKDENISERFYETPLGESEEEHAEKNSLEDLEHFYEDPNKKENLDDFYDKPSENEKLSVDEVNKREINDEQNKEETLDSYYDKPTEDDNNGTFYDKPSSLDSTGEFYDKPSQKMSQASLPDNLDNSQEKVFYDKPRGSTDYLYDKPKGSQGDLYDTPPATPKRTESFRNSDPSVSDKLEKVRPQLKTRSSAPALQTFAVGAAASRLPHKSFTEPRFNVLPEKRHSGAELLVRNATSSDMSSDGITLESEECYSTPPSRPSKSPSSSGSDLGSPANQEIYDVPTDSGSSSEQTLASKSAHGSDKVESPKDKEQKTRPMDKKGIFLNVMKKIGEKLLLPFLEVDCLTLARHMTRVDLILQWGEEPHRQSWTIEDGTGGAKGLEIMTLPQGRDQRAQLLARSVSFYVYKTVFF